MKDRTKFVKANEFQAKSSRPNENLGKNNRQFILLLFLIVFRLMGDKTAAAVAETPAAVFLLLNKDFLLFRIPKNNKKKEKKMFKTLKKVHEKKDIDKTTKCQTKSHAQHRRHNRRDGFTLVELVITIAIVIILSVISVPIYRGYVDKAKYAEGYALLGTILSAQKAYYSEYGNFFRTADANGQSANFPNYATSYCPELEIDARGNKYFTEFALYCNTDLKFKYQAVLKKPIDTGSSYMYLVYNLTTGANIGEKDSW